MIALEMNKITDEEIADSLREEILAAVTTAKAKQRPKKYFNLRIFQVQKLVYNSFLYLIPILFISFL